ncbi:hypothetical protein CHARACLAT_025284 [Characodon lateralis]|uniref:Uncharacterized protein n=1 Tax=Characodon lateralis TaxID=208331 RepID=A0ABU7D0P3_9TELE|nr:hypothetical protein [Characodon lateralis]
MQPVTLLVSSGDSERLRPLFALKKNLPEGVATADHLLPSQPILPSLTVAVPCPPWQLNIQNPLSINHLSLTG